MSGKSKETTGLQVFPFLAVLICTMGSLIFLLLVTTQQVRKRAIAFAAFQLAQQRLAAKESAKPPVSIPEPAPEPEPEPEPQPQLIVIPAQKPVRKSKPVKLPDQNYALLLANRERELTDLKTKWKLRVDHLSKERNGRRAALSRQKEQIVQSLDESDSLKAEVDRLETHLGRVSGEAAAVSIKAKDDQARLLLEQQIAEMKKQLKSAEIAELTDSAKFQVVPFDPLTGTTRRPIFLECNEQGIRFLPEDITITAADLSGFTSRVNPLAAGTGALINYWAAKNLRQRKPSAEQEPYVLLLVRPNGVCAYYVAMKMLETIRTQHGYELIDESISLQLPDVDAGAKAACQAAVDRLLTERENVFRSAMSSGGSGSVFGTSLMRGGGSGQSRGSGNSSGPYSERMAGIRRGEGNLFTISDVTGEDGEDRDSDNWDRMANSSGRPPRKSGANGSRGGGSGGTDGTGTSGGQGTGGGLYSGANGSRGGGSGGTDGSGTGGGQGTGGGLFSGTNGSRGGGSGGTDGTGTGGGQGTGGGLFSGTNGSRGAGSGGTDDTGMGGGQGTGSELFSGGQPSGGSTLFGQTSGGAQSSGTSLISQDPTGTSPGSGQPGQGGAMGDASNSSQGSSVANNGGTGGRSGRQGSSGSNKGTSSATSGSGTSSDDSLGSAGQGSENPQGQRSGKKRGQTSGSTNGNSGGQGSGGQGSDGQGSDDEGTDSADGVAGAASGGKGGPGSSPQAGGVSSPSITFGNSSSWFRQGNAAKPSPTSGGANRKSKSSTDLENKQLEPEMLAGRRWGFSEPGASIGFEREVRVEVENDKIVLAERYTVPIKPDQSKQELFEQFAMSLDRHSHEWGRPPQGFFWTPRLKFVVKPDASSHYEQLNSLMLRAGMATTHEFARNTTIIEFGREPPTPAKPLSKAASNTASGVNR